MRWPSPSDDTSRTSHKPPLVYLAVNSYSTPHRSRQPSPTVRACSMSRGRPQRPVRRTPVTREAPSQEPLITPRGRRRAPASNTPMPPFAPGSARGRPLARREPSASRPISRVLSRAIIHLGHSSPGASSGLPEPSADHALGLLFGLAPGGVCLAADVAAERGALLPHPFTLAAGTVRVPEAVCSLLHFPWARAPQALPGALSFGARTFLCAA